MIEAAWENRALLSEKTTREAIESIIESLDKGQIRVANQSDDGTWSVNEWIKKAVVMYFPIRKMETIEVGPFEFHDKMRLKTNYAALGIRVVPGASARYGAFLAEGVIMMPSYINIGAYVDSGTMVDTWATVGSCAQIGKNVHLSGGVGIGVVLEPLQAAPVIVEDDAFIGSEKPITYLLAGTSIDTGVFGSKLKPFFSARLNPNGENQTHIGGTFDFKDTVEIGGGYKSIGYSNVMLIVKTKFGLTAAYAYDFGIPSGQVAVTRSGNEIFLKFKF